VVDFARPALDTASDTVVFEVLSAPLFNGASKPAESVAAIWFPTSSMPSI